MADERKWQRREPRFWPAIMAVLLTQLVVFVSFWGTAQWRHRNESVRMGSRPVRRVTTTPRPSLALWLALAPTVVWLVALERTRRAGKKAEKVLERWGEGQEECAGEEECCSPQRR